MKRKTGVSKNIIGVTRTILAAAAFAFGLSEPGLAQDVHIFTKVFDEAADLKRGPKKKAPVIGRSLTLFHAGKVYDYVGSIGEVTIFDPAHSKIIILNPQRQLKTTVHFDEIMNMLKLADEVTDASIKDLQRAGNAQAKVALALAQFQKNPNFNEQFNDELQKLSLSSRFIHYEVNCSDAKRPGFAEKYLHYADWMSRLNYVLHPTAQRPEPRLALNAALRHLKRFPVEVELRANFDSQIHRRAKHSYAWKLDHNDRSLIDQWENLLAGRSTRAVTLKEYQKKILLSELKKRR